MQKQRYLRDHSKGFILVMIAAISYGLQPFFSHFAYNDGANPVGLLISRFLIAALLILCWLKIKKIRFPRKKPLMQSMLIGVGYAGAALGYYNASHTTSVSLAVILMFSFPAFVTLYSILFLKESATAGRLISMILAMLGVMLAAGIEFRGDLNGILWALFAAISYGAAIIYGSHNVTPENPLASACSILFGCVLTLSMASLLQHIELPQSVSGWSATLGLALFATILPIATFISGSPRIGAASASTLSTLEPVVAVLIAVSLIGEQLNLSAYIGGLLVLIAAFVLSRQPVTHAA
jgi:drug/metabolite transporter (DMT)-like permease